MRLLLTLLVLLLLLLPLTAGAMTKHECIRLGEGCQWSKSMGGRINGWYYAKAKETRHENVHRHAAPRTQLPSDKPSEPEYETHRRTLSAFSGWPDALADALGTATGGHGAGERGVIGTKAAAKSDEGHRKEVMPPDTRGHAKVDRGLREIPATKTTTPDTRPWPASWPAGADTPSQAIPETIGAAIAQPPRWLAWYEKSFQQDQTAVIPAAVIPVIRPVAAAAALPAHVSSAWWDVLYALIIIVLIAALVWAFAHMIGWAFKGWQSEIIQEKT